MHANKNSEIFRLFRMVVIVDVGNVKGCFMAFVTRYYQVKTGMIILSFWKLLLLQQILFNQLIQITVENFLSLARVELSPVIFDHLIGV